MVESLKELNKICQKPRYRETGNWMVRRILRDAALPITWLLLHTSVTANQVTLFSLGVALLGIFFIALPPAGFFFAGALCLQLWYFLDHVDGQIARYRKTAGLTGRFFDFMTHHIVEGVFFFSLGLYAYQKTRFFPFVIGAFLAAFSMTLFKLIYDTKYKAYFEKILTLDKLEIRKPESPVSGPSSEKAPSVWKTSFSFFHKLCEMHVVMNIFTLAAVLEYGFKFPFDFRFSGFLIYGALVPVLAVTKITYWIKERTIDAEFEARFRIAAQG